jgi:hypothetical protein
MPINWVRFTMAPATTSRSIINLDEQNVEFCIEFDQMKDEELGYFDPRPWLFAVAGAADSGLRISTFF